MLDYSLKNQYLILQKLTNSFKRCFNWLKSAQKNMREELSKQRVIISIAVSEINSLQFPSSENQPMVRTE